MSKGMNQSEIAQELRTTRHTIMRDLKEINQWTKKELYDLAKQTLPTMYYNSIIGQNELAKECWKIYKTDPAKDPSINNWHKIAALRLLIDINKSKFQMFQDGPTFMEVNRLQSELERIKRDYLKDNDNSFRPFIKPSTTTYEESKRLRDLTSESKSEYKEDDKTLVNARGIPYKIADSQELEKEEEDKEDSDPAADHK